VTPDQWQRIKDVFDAALETDSVRRDAYIAEACAGDAAIEFEVRRMLAAVDSNGPLDDVPVSPSEMARILAGLDSRFEPGQILADRFRIVRLLGRGGMGEVWEAFDQQLKESVAIKTVHTEGLLDPLSVDRFKTEVQRTRQVAHPNVCRVYDLFFHEGIPFLTMELLDGESLAQRIAREGKIAQPGALRILEQCASALSAAHAAGLVHRDLKPGNVMLPSPGRAVVTDFGLARPMPETATSQVTSAGTPAYMAPEQAAGREATTASDVYSFAVLACEVLTGQRPSEGGMEALTPAWRTAVQRGLNASPASRPPSAQALLRLASSSRRPVLAAAFLLAATLAGGGFVLWRTVAGGRARTPAEERTVAILPFETPGAQADSLGEALSGEIATSLTRLHELRVIPGGSDSRVRGEARYLVTGSARRDGTRLRVLVQLIDTRANTQVWAESYDRPARDILWIEGQISRAVAAQLGVSSLVQKNWTPAPAGGEEYLYGRFLLDRRVGDSVKGAVEHLERAVVQSPDFAEAHAALAEALIVLAEQGLAPAGPAIDRARSAAEKALAFDPRLAEAHSCRGFLAGAADHDFASAEHHFLRAIDLNPRLTLARQWYSYNLLRQRRFDEARAQALAAVELDPLAMPAQQNLAVVYYYMRDWSGMRRVCTRLLELDPHHFFAHLLLAHEAAMAGRVAAMDRELALAQRNAAVPALYQRMAAEAYGAARQPRRAEPLLALLLDPKSGVSSAYIAAALASVGRIDEAFDRLETAWQEQDLFLPMLAVYPAFDSLRGDARYRSLLVRLGLAGQNK
jgi:TolB-like protein/Tfp pilus assembly protein PilF